VYKVLVGRPEENGPLRKPRRILDHNGSLRDWLGGGVDSVG
jgi:hypothetical protein